MNSSIHGENSQSGQFSATPTDLVRSIHWATKESYLGAEQVAPSSVWSEAATQGLARDKARYASWVDLFLTLERPHVNDLLKGDGLLKGTDRGERYRLQMAHAWTQRQRLEHWIEEQGLCDEIRHLGEPNCFHVLFIRCTPAAARRFAHAPGVIDLAISQPD